MVTNPMTEREIVALRALLNQVRDMLNVAIVERDPNTGHPIRIATNDVRPTHYKDLDEVYRHFRQLRIDRIMGGELV